MTLGNLEATLHTQPDFLAAVVDQMGALVVVFDLKGKIVYFNRACEATTGYSLEEVLGKSGWDLFFIPEEVEVVRTVFEQLQTGQFSQRCENHWVTKDGICRLIAWSNNALVNSCGAVEYIVSTGIDITESRQAEVAKDDALTRGSSEAESLQTQTSRRHSMTASGCPHQICWVSGRDRVLPEESGTFASMAGVELGINQQHQPDTALEESERFIKWVTDSIPGIIYIYDIIDKCNIYCNHQASLVLGYTPAEIQQLGADFFPSVIHPDDLANMQGLFSKIATAKDGEVIETEYRIRHKNGDWLWFLSRDTVFLRNADGTPQQLLGTACDITSRKQTEAALQKSEQLYRTLAHNFPNGIVLLFDRDLRYTIADGKGLELIGFSSKLMEGKTIWEVLPPETCEEIEPIYRSVLVGEAIAWEMTFRDRSGYVQALPVKNEQGEIFAGLVVVNDVTERKQTEDLRTKLIASLRESEERFRCLIDQARDAIFAIDSDGWFVEVNQRACQDLGYTYPELLTLGVWDLDPTWTEERFTELFQQQTDLRSDDTFEAAIKRKDGSTFPVEIRIGLLEWNHQQYMLALVRDITKRKRAEQVQTGLIEFLQESDERFRQMAENIRDIFWMRQINPPQLLYISPAYEEIWGCSCASLYEEPYSFLDAVHPEDRDRAIAAFERQIQGHPTDIEYKIIQKNGSIRWVHERGFPILNANGEVYRVTGIIEDITERKLAQMALEQSKEELEIRVRERTAALLVANNELRQEIIERKQAELALAKSQQELELFFSQSLDGFFFMMLDEPICWDDTVDKETALDYVFSHQRMAKVNHAMLTQYGTTKEQFIRITPQDLFAHDLVYGRQVWQQLFDEGRLHVETHERKFDGTPIWIEGDYICLYDKTGKIIGHFGVQRDISDRKMAEQALQESQKRYTLAVSAGKVGVWDWNLETNEIYVDPFLKAILGYADGEISNHIDRWGKLVHPDDAKKVMVAADDYLQGLTSEYSVEHRMLHKDGSIRWFLARGTAIRDASGKPYRLMGTDTDITDRKLTEVALCKSEERFRSLVANVPGVIYRSACDSHWTMEYISDAIADVSGYPAFHFIQNRVRTFASIIHPQDMLMVEISVREAAAQNKPFAIEYRIVKPDGSSRWVADRGQAHYGEEGEVLWIDGVIFDISDRKIAEQELHQSEQRLRLVVQNMPILLDAYDESGNLVVWNRECERVTGYSAKEIVGNPKAMEMLYPEPNYRQQIIERGTKRDRSFRDWEWQLTCKDGTVKTIAWFSICEQFPIPGWTGWAVGVDISDRKKAEEEIRSALAKEKELSELKTRFITMASHEFRTPLSTILSSADLLEYYVQDNLTVKQLEHIHRIQTACLNMAQLLNDVLVIGRAEAGKLEFNPLPINLVAFCRDLVEEMQLSAGDRYQITFQLGNGISSMEPCNQSDACLSANDLLTMTEFISSIDDKLLRYILNNLLSNAIKYSPSGGNIYLRLDYQDNCAILQVEDEGIGIPKEDKDRLFEPFYRGKNVDNITGTGLGLAIVKRSVELHQGQINLKSKIAKGTTFTVTLPLHGNC